MRKYIAILFLFLFANTFYPQCGDRYKTNLFLVDTSTHKFGENYTYNGTLQSLNLALFTPKGDTVKKRPCIIFCFGGAFVQGSRTSPELTFIADYLAKMGFVCASIDYRLDNTTNMAMKGESGAVVRAVQDAKAAVRFLKSKSVDFGLDTTNFFIGGTSAGGITALTLGYSQYNDFSNGIKLVIDSLGGWEGTSNSLTNSSKVKGLFNFSGGILDTSHIISNDLPIYLNHATQDVTVPFYSGYPLNGQSTTLIQGSGNIAKRMKNLNNYFIIDSFQSSNHPAFITSDFLLTYNLTTTTAENLRKFLYKIIGCTDAVNSIINGHSSPMKIPNPVLDKIILPKLDKEESIVLYNQIGLKVMETKTKEEFISISHLPSGVYFLHCQNQFIKLVKE